MLIISLSECRETGRPVAAYDDRSVTDYRSPLTKLARALIADHDMFEIVSVCRDGRQVFKPAPLWAFARVTAAEPVGQSVRLTKYRQDPRFSEAS